MSWVVLGTWLVEFVPRESALDDYWVLKYPAGGFSELCAL